MSKTKQKIISASVALFNERGFSAVSLRDISNEIGISQGNLTYHFRTKEILLRAIYEQMLQESVAYIMPEGFVTLHHFEQMMMQFHRYQHKYRFFFIDMVQIFRTFPKMGEMYEKSVEVKLTQAKKLIAYYIESERMMPATDEIDYERLSHSLWMLSAFWLSQNEILPKGKFYGESPINHFWQLVLPFLTEKGKMEYEEITKYRDPKNLLYTID